VLVFTPTENAGSHIQLKRNDAALEEQPNNWGFNEPDLQQPDAGHHPAQAEAYPVCRGNAAGIRGKVVGFVDSCIIYQAIPCEPATFFGDVVRFDHTRGV